MLRNYNLALVCDDEGLTLERMSRALNEAAPSKYILGENSLAHISVFQFAAEEEQLPRIWERASKLGDAFNVRANAFYIQSKAPGDTHTYTGLSVQNGDGALHSLHRNYLEAFESEVTPMMGGRGPKYFPHITLGYNQLSRDTRLVAPLDQDSPLWQQDIHVRPSLGIAGPEWQLTTSLYSLT